jgi:hypothetical protein
VHRVVAALFVLVSATTCGDASVDARFLDANGDEALDPVALDTTASFRALYRRDGASELAIISENGGMTILTAGGDTRELFHDIDVEEVERDPLDPDLLVAYLLAEQFALVRGEDIVLHDSVDTVVDFLLADLELDGATDLVALVRDGSVLVWDDYATREDLATGMTRIAEVATPFYSRHAPDRPRLLAAGDFDGDARDDIVALGDDGQAAAVLTGQPMQTQRFQASQLVVTAQLDGGIGDELVTLSPGEQGVVLRWNGRVFERLATLARGDARIRALDIGDLDGDGIDAIVVSEGDRGVLEIFEPSEAAVWAAKQIRSADIQSAAVGDFDGDGTDEIAVVEFVIHNYGCY